MELTKKSPWKFWRNSVQLTRRPASTGIFFAHLRIFWWWTFANGSKRYYCFEFSFQRFSTNINPPWISIFLCRRLWVSRFSVEKFLSHSAEKIRGRTLRYFRKFRVSKNFMHKRGLRGVLRFSFGNFFVSQYRKTSQGNPSVIQKISGSEKC